MVLRASCMANASCLCGSVTWCIAGPFEYMSHCHCSRCRKTHGSAFSTYVAGPADSFTLNGGAHVVRWQSSPDFVRNFCARCGSVVPGDPFHGLMFVPAGNFLDDPGARPAAHIFVSSKAPWYEIPDALPQFAGYPEGFDAPVIDDRAPLDDAGQCRGSCLCGTVTYVLEQDPVRAVNCHCGRCRRARSAAHASNLFVPDTGMRFTRGTDALASYKVPEAQFFTQVFCRVCGSCLPRSDPSRGIAVVPMGSLDDAPGLRPQRHIFVADKAPWFDIADALPQHPAYPT